ncbi:MAG: TetR/AcrR family transcriptional regulator [Acidimicrobiia bacterium]
MTADVSIDRPAAIRLALRDMVAERGFHGASMGVIATRAGVAAGTAYVHYESKEELVYATFLEVKGDLGAAVLTGYPADATPFDRWNHLLRASFRYLEEEPARARFLSQLEESPYYEEAHARHVARGDALTEAAAASDIVELLVDLPVEVIYAMSLGVAVRLVSSGVKLSEDELDTLVESTWRALTRE